MDRSYFFTYAFFFVFIFNTSMYTQNNVQTDILIARLNIFQLRIKKKKIKKELFQLYTFPLYDVSILSIITWCSLFCTIFCLFFGCQAHTLSPVTSIAFKTEKNFLRNWKNYSKYWPFQICHTTSIYYGQKNYWASKKKSVCKFSLYHDSLSCKRINEIVLILYSLIL